MYRHIVQPTIHRQHQQKNNATIITLTIITSKLPIKTLVPMDNSIINLTKINESLLLTLKEFVIKGQQCEWRK